MSSQNDNAFEAVAAYAEEAEKLQKNCTVHNLTLSVDVKPAIDAAITAWGGVVKDFRAAPNWAVIEGLIGVASKEDGFKISWAADENGAGIAAFGPQMEQEMALDAIFKTVGEGGADAGIEASVLEQAAAAFLAVISKLSSTAPLSDGPAGFISSALAALSADEGDIRLVGYGKLQKEQLEELVKVAKKAPEDETPPTGSATAAPPAPKKPRYSSLGQIVKAGDAASLLEWVEELDRDSKKRGTSSDNEEMYAKLLWHSFAQGQIECAKVLAERLEEPLSFRDDNGVSCFLAAAMSNKPEGMDYAISIGAALTESDCDGRSAAMLASDADAELCLKRLFEMGVNPNEQSLDGLTALHIAAAKGSKKAVAALIEVGADPSIEDLMDGMVASRFVDQDDNPDLYDQLELYRENWDAGKIRRPSGP